MRTWQLFAAAALPFFWGELSLNGACATRLPLAAGEKTAVEESVLPEQFDPRAERGMLTVKNQGVSETCWAYAAVSALESSLWPQENWSFSVEHLLKSQTAGEKDAKGDYSIAMSYFLSWKGPVLEDTDETAAGHVMKHVQEIQLLPRGNREAVKNAVIRYGGVLTGLHMTLKNAESFSTCYMPETASYYYDGTEDVNHDVVIVGWDDTWSRFNFYNPPHFDGAFLCMNSWGEEFGDEGYFWVSYADMSLLEYNMVYTGVEDANNYDRLYESDQMGWAGQIGFGDETAWFANVYTAVDRESLQAVGFYAVDMDTNYRVWAVGRDFDRPVIRETDPVAEGSLQHAGFYTIPLDEPLLLEEGDAFAVIVEIQTPGTGLPVAVECDSADNRQVDLSDGQGYISHDGMTWERAETKKACSPCLKAYTVNVLEETDILDKEYEIEEDSICNVK